MIRSILWRGRYIITTVFWQKILGSCNEREKVLNYISNGVSVFDFFQHFKGEYKGRFYDSDLPPPTIFPNNPICNQFKEFISSSLVERVRNDSISIWRKEGQCQPPHLVMPITVEPFKPRLCHDERFLNLWMITPPVSLNQITDLPRYVEPGHFQSKLDDKSGYDHIILTKENRDYFGLLWKGWFLSSIPYLLAAYFSTDLGSTHCIRSNNIPASQYMGDLHICQMSPTTSNLSWSNFDLAKASVFVSALVLVLCGYFVGLKKSIFVPAQVLPFLGFISDSVRQAFLLPEEKKRKFAILRDHIIESKVVVDKRSNDSSERLSRFL